MTGLQHLLALEFMRSAFVAGGCIALAAGLVLPLAGVASGLS